MLLDRLFKTSAQRPEVREGATFRHIGPGNLIETAKVLELMRDPMGIPHVRFDLIVERNRQPLESLTTSRTLNLQSFTSHFTDAVADAVEIPDAVEA